MLNFKGIALFTCAILSFSAAAFVDTLSKCSIKDGDCQGAQLTASIKRIYKTGVPELGIPPLDPLKFKDMKITVSNLYDLYIPEGEATGVKDCVVESYKIEVEKGHAEMKLKCSTFKFNAKYELNASNSLFKTLFGKEAIHGAGNAKVEMEKFEMNFDFYFDLVKNKDGDVFFKWKPNQSTYVYQVLGKPKFNIDNIFLGDTNASKEVMAYLNENSNFVINTFGKPFVDKAMELVYLYYGKFFGEVPAKYFIIEDLSKYV